MNPVYFPVALAAVITIATAHADPAKAVLADVGLSSEGNSWASPGEDDEGVDLISTGDFNRDGIADMVEATGGRDSGQHFLTVLLGQVDGTFRNVASHNLVDGDPRELLVGDFNRDGNLDVLVGEGGGGILEFLGDGTGKMEGTGKIATFGSVASIAAGHFTKSGDLDLVISDVRSNSAVILLGAGDGTFRFKWSFELPKRGKEFHVAIADFNNDGTADLVITNEDDDNYEVMLGNGNGTFTYAPELSHLRDPNSYCPS